MALIELQLAVLVLVRPSTTHDPPVEIFKTCWKVSRNFSEEIELASAATEEYAVFGYVTIELATTLPCLFMNTIQD